MPRHVRMTSGACRRARSTRSSSPRSIGAVSSSCICLTRDLAVARIAQAQSACCTRGPRLVAGSRGKASPGRPGDERSCRRSWAICRARWRRRTRRAADRKTRPGDGRARHHAMTFDNAKTPPTREEAGKRLKRRCRNACRWLSRAPRRMRSVPSRAPWRSRRHRRASGRDGSRGDPRDVLPAPGLRASATPLPSPLLPRDAATPPAVGALARHGGRAPRAGRNPPTSPTHSPSRSAPRIASPRQLDAAAPALSINGRLGMAKAYWVATYKSISDPDALAGYAKLRRPGYDPGAGAASSSRAGPPRGEMPTNPACCQRVPSSSNSTASRPGRAPRMTAPAIRKPCARSVTALTAICGSSKVCNQKSKAP